MHKHVGVGREGGQGRRHRETVQLGKHPKFRDPQNARARVRRVVAYLVAHDSPQLAQQERSDAHLLLTALIHLQL